MRLFVDDIRPIPAGYDGARDAETAIELMTCTPYELVSLDYDLGYDRPNGLDLLHMMKENGVFPPAINIHSTHPLGRKRMWDYVEENFPGCTLTAIAAYY